MAARTHERATRRYLCARSCAASGVLAHAATSKWCPCMSVVYFTPSAAEVVFVLCGREVASRECHLARRTTTTTTDLLLAYNATFCE